MKRTILISAIIVLTAAVSLAFAAQEGTQATDGVKFAQPVLISSAGQSADVKMVGMMAKRLDLDAKVEIMAKPEQLEGVKTLIIVPGFSSKGLGAAGISQKDELERVVALIDAANKKEIPILMVHIGGNARRQGQSDDFNDLAAKNSKYMIVVEQGNADGFFSRISGDSKVPIEIVSKIPDTIPSLEKLFK